jgi:hypothetical protein
MEVDVMVTTVPHQSAALSEKLIAIATAAGATTSTPAPNCVEGKVTAISAKWLLGGRRVVHTFQAMLDPESREVRFRERATEASWGVPPPTLEVQVTGQRGARVNQARTDTSVGGGGRLAYGQFREEVERAVQEAGWKFVLTVA